MNKEKDASADNLDVFIWSGLSARGKKLEGEITGSSKIVRLSLEKYALPIIQSFNVSKLIRIGFDRADKATANLPPIEGTKNINVYKVIVRGIPQKENEPNIMIGAVSLTGSTKMRLLDFGKI